jgi:hypothetical protein
VKIRELSAGWKKQKIIIITLDVATTDSCMLFLYALEASSIGDKHMPRLKNN